jgi:hypothetical protein
MELNVKIKKVNLLITSGTDIINITLDEESSFPTMKYDVILKIECQKGYGEEYCKKILRLTPNVIDIS